MDNFDSRTVQIMSEYCIENNNKIMHNELDVIYDNVNKNILFIKQYVRYIINGFDTLDKYFVLRNINRPTPTDYYTVMKYNQSNDKNIALYAKQIMQMSCFVLTIHLRASRGK